MKYLRQIHPAAPTSTIGNWYHVKADSPRDAALAGLDLDKLGQRTAVIMVAPDTKRNRWPNGRPIMVHQISIEIGD